MKNTMKILTKIALFLVIFGFFQPMYCDANSFELAEKVMDRDGIIPAVELYAIFIAAVISIAFTIFIILGKGNITSSSTQAVDFFLLLIGIIGGCIPLFMYMDDLRSRYIEHGLYIVATGYGASLLFHLFSCIKEKH